MNDYDENKESSYLVYLDTDNLYVCAMSQNLAVGGFKWVKNVSIIDEKFIKDCCNGIGFILKVDIEYSKELHDLHSYLPFLPKRMKINKCNKLVCILCDKKTMLSLLKNA